MFRKENYIANRIKISMPEFMDWVRHYGIQPKVMLDLGAFDATDALCFKENFPEARVIAIEGDRGSFDKSKAGSLE